MKGYLQLVRLAFSYRREAFLVIASNFFFVIFNLLSLVLFIPFLELIFDPESQKTALKISAPIWEKRENLFSFLGEYFEFWKADFVLRNGAQGALLFICISVLLAFFLKNLFRYSAIFFQSYPRMAVVRDIRERLFTKTLGLPLSYYSEEKKGDLLSRMTNDLGEIEIAVVYVLEMIFREPVAIILYLSLLFYMSPELTYFSLILLPVSGLVVSKIGSSLKKTSKQGQDEMGLLLSVIEEALGGIKIVKAFIAEEITLKRFRKRNDRHQSLLTKTFRKKDLSSPLTEFMGAAVLVSVVYYGGILVIGEESTMTGKVFLGYIMLFSQLLRPISGFTRGITSLKKAEASLDRINEVMSITNTIENPENPILKSSFDKDIVFDNVNFDYGEEPVLKDINITIKKGETVALVGESGSGKSTLADLLPRFYDSKLGEIKIDDVNVKEISKNDLRNLVSVVSQDSILFNDTIANNIALARPNASREEIEEAAKVANAHQFISDFPEGYESNIGDGGNKLSGGQKQRISIARAVLSNAPIMILDEATSALDTESEKLVQQALEAVMKNRTSIVIAHRLSTIRNANKIYVMQRGEIVEEGNHDELIGRGGYYKTLCEIQQVL